MEKISLKSYLDQCVNYRDGRFAKDKMWCFYVYNYAVRHENNTSGNFFVDRFFRQGPANLAELQEQLLKGNTSWVDHITYFGVNLRGSTGFWRAKRAEVYS